MRPAHIKEQRAKEVRQINKEKRRIWREIQELPNIKLKKPYRHGWYKEIVLTKNIERYKNRKYIEEIFNVLDTYYWGRTKKECMKKWDKQRSNHFIFREVPTISKKQFNKLSTRAQKLCTPFQYRECKKLRTRFYIRIPKNAYRIKFTRAYITHVKMHDPTLHSREDFLEQRLLAPGLYEADNNNYVDRWSVSDTKRSRIKVKQELGRYKHMSYENIGSDLLNNE